jgi:hypothetical protein
LVEVSGSGLYTWLMHKSKRCPLCGKRKLLTKFNVRRSQPDGRQVHCKACCRKQAITRYQKNPLPYKLRAYNRRDRLRELFNAFIAKLRLEYGCQVCAERECCTLDFHHLIKGKPITRVSSYAEFGVELKKCTIVCANCHRKIHGGILQAPKSPFGDVQVPKLPSMPFQIVKSTLKAAARNRGNNRLLEFNGQKKPLAAWAEEYGLSYRVAWARLKAGWSVDKLLSTPTHSYTYITRQRGD